STLAFQSFPELRLGKRVEQSHHREWNRALADEIDLPLKDIKWIVIKADDETSHDLHSVILNFLYGAEQFAAVLRLLLFVQALLDRCFDADKDATKTSVAHTRKQR